MAGNLTVTSNSANSGVTATTALKPALLKLIEVIEEENAVLKEHKILFHSDFTARKNQGLRELMAAQRMGESREAATDCRDVLDRLRSALRINTSLHWQKGFA